MWFDNCFPAHDFITLNPYPRSPRGFVRIKVPNVEGFICISRPTLQTFFLQEENHLMETNCEGEPDFTAKWFNLKLPVPGGHESGGIGLGQASFLVPKRDIVTLTSGEMLEVQLKPFGNLSTSLWSYDAWIGETYRRLNPGVVFVPGEPSGGWFFRGTHGKHLPTFRIASMRLHRRNKAGLVKLATQFGVSYAGIDFRKSQHKKRLARSLENVGCYLFELTG